MMKILKSRSPLVVVLLLLLSLILMACAPTATPGATPTKAPAGAATAVATKAPSGATPAGGTSAGPAGLSAEGQKAAAEVPPQYKGKKNPFTLNDQTAISAGEGIYKQRCLTCHGEKGDGKGPAGSALKPPPANYSTAQQLEHFEKIQDHHFWRTNEGVSGTAMPAFKGQLSEEQIWQVMTYEWSLGKKGAGQ